MTDPATTYSVWALSVGSFCVGFIGGGFLMGLAAVAGTAAMCENCSLKAEKEMVPRLCDEKVEGKPCTQLTVPGSRFCRQHFAAHA
jgi:hypothetical protein